MILFPSLRLTKNKLCCCLLIFLFTRRGPLGGDIDPHLFPYPNKLRTPLDEEKITSGEYLLDGEMREFLVDIHHFFNCNDFM